MNLRTFKPFSKDPPAQQENSPFSPRPFAVQARGKKAAREAGAFQDQQGAPAAAVTQAPSGPPVLQRFFKFTLKKDAYEIESATYIRSQSILTLIGRVQGKHTTADVAQRPAFEIYFKPGRSLDDAAFNFLVVAESYTNLPGMELLQFHHKKTGSGVTINEGMIEAYNAVDKLKLNSLDEQKVLAKAIEDFRKGDNQKAAAYDLVTSLERLVDITEKLRDLVPLTNLWSKNEKRGNEPEAMKVLEPLETSMLDNPMADIPDKKHPDLLANMWRLFDFGAISMLLSEHTEEDIEEAVADHLPWLDFQTFLKASSKVAKNKIDAVHLIVAFMLAQHVRQMAVSFHNIDFEVNIGDRKNVEAALKKANPGGLDIEKVLGYLYDTEVSPLKN